MNQDQQKTIIIGSLGHIKYWLRGMKFYAPIVATITKPRYLRRHQRTASAADNYGKQVAERFQRWQKTPAAEPDQAPIAAIVDQAES